MLRIGIVAVAFPAMTAALAASLWVIGRLKLPGSKAVSRAYSRTLCKLLGVRIEIVGRLSNDRPMMVVANHCSWLDILVLTAVSPVIFVAKREVASWPLVGAVAKARPTVFVDRTRRHQTAEVAAAIAERLAHGDPVVLFAEGTSSDGNRVLQFRSALFGAADTLVNGGHSRGVLLQPVSIAYTRIQGLPIGRQHRPLVAWYGDMGLVRHVTRILRRGAIDVVVTFGEQIEYGPGERKAMVKFLESHVRRLTVSALRGDTTLHSGPAIPFSTQSR
jgi:1-acyl-sn-glycerol-3-phosphate acyltransferase